MLEVIILAAGKGTRMRSSLPKVLHPLAGKPFLGHVLDRALELQADKTHMIIGHGAAAIQQAFADDPRSAQYNYVMQEQQLGTGHAVQQVLPHLDKDATAIIVYGDVPLIRSATLKNLRALASDSSMALLTITLDDANGYGRIVRDGEGKVSAIVEDKDATPEQKQIKEINTGMMAVRCAHLISLLPQLKNNNAQGEYYLTDLIELARENNIEVKTCQPQKESEIMGVNNRKQQAELERIRQAEIADSLMENGLTLLDPSRFDCRGELSVGEDCIVDVNCIFEGQVKLGNNVKIAANCIIKDAEIGDNVEINANSVIEDSMVDAGCIVGPYARLRPGTQLKEGAKIGNFVETKKAIIGEGSKVNHLSYIGDAELGKGVNVGAGSITCNYDGVNKHKTTIGDGAFIGSNSILIAPIKVGDEAFTGAGSTISNDVPEGTLSVARAKQRNIEGWQRPKKK